jgi:hypothetical protein
MDRGGDRFCIWDMSLRRRQRGYCTDWMWDVRTRGSRMMLKLLFFATERLDLFVEMDRIYFV